MGLSPEAKAALATLPPEDKAEAMKALGVEDKPAAITAEDVQKLVADAEKRAADEAAANIKAFNEARAAVRPEQRPLTEDGAEFKGGEEPEPTTVKGFYNPRLPQDRRWKADDFFQLTPKEAEELGFSAAAQEAWHELSDDLIILGAGMRHGGNPYDVRRSKAYRRYWGENSALKRTISKALYSTGTGVGDEWVPTVMSPSWLEKIHMEGEVAPNFPLLSMPTNPTLFPIFAGRSATAYLAGESTTDEAAKFIASNVTTAQLSMSAKQIVVRVPWSQEFEEDAIMSALDYVRQDISNSAAFYVDRAIMDGDATGGASSHFDTGLSLSSADVRVAFNGLRRRCLDSSLGITGANVNCAGVTWSSANMLVNALANMGQYMGKNPISFCSRTLLPRMGLMRDSNNNLVNSPATSGERAATAAPARVFQGWPVIPTDHILDTYNTSGIYDGSTKTCTEVLWVNPDVWYRATRRDWTIEVEKDILTQQWNLVLHCRMAFDTPYADTDTTAYISSAAFGLVVASF